MNTKSLTYKSSFWAKSTALILIIMLMLLALPVRSASAAPLAAIAPDGQGSMIVSPTTVVYGTSTAFTFTFTPTVGDYPIGTSVELTIPTGWTVPVELTNVTVAAGTCNLNPAWQITGQVIIIDVNECLFGQFFTISYTGTPGPVSGSIYTFTSQTDVPGGNGKFNTAVMPQITVTPKALTVTGITGVDKVYGTGPTVTLNTISAALVGVVGTDVVSLGTLPTTGLFTAPYYVGTNKPVTVAAITLTGADSGNYTLTQPSVTASILSKELTVTGTTGNNKVYDGGTSATVNTISSVLVGNLDGTNVVLVKTGATGVFTPDGNIGTGKTVQVSGFTISGSSAFNYTLTQPTTTANITAKALTVTGITASDKTYDATTSAIIDVTGAALSGVETVDVGNVTLGTTLAVGAFTPNGNVGVGKIVQISGLTLSGSAIGNYTLTQPTTTASITALSVTVTPDAGQGKVYGVSDPTFTYNNTALFGTDAITGNLGRTLGENVGTYPFAIGTLTAGSNYSLSVTAQTFSITPKPITVTAVTDTKIYNGTTSSSGVPSISPALIGTDTNGFTQSFDNKNVGTSKTLTPAGVVNDGNGGANYTVTLVTNTTGTITTASVSVTANPQTKVYGAADPAALTYVVTPSLFAGDAFSGLLARANGEDVGTYAINQGTLTAGGNYAISFTGNNLSITQAALTATANDKTIIFGSPDPVFDLTYTGFQFTDTVAVLDTAPTCGVSGAHTDVGTYPITCSGGSDNNYSFTYVDGTLTVSPVPVAIFADVPLTYWANSFIERLYNAGITGGCGTGPLIYCPDSTVTRAQMAVFLLRGIHGRSYAPPTATGTVFTDVSASSFAAAWIEQLALEGITGGCGVGIYCPDATVTRAQMAIFLLRSKHGSTYAPPSATGTVFTDVSTSSFAAAWIEQLALEGVTGGCGSGKYCPDGSVTRAEMAVFLVRTFNLP